VQQGRGHAGHAGDWCPPASIVNQLLTFWGKTPCKVHDASNGALSCSGHSGSEISYTWNFCPERIDSIANDLSGDILFALEIPIKIRTYLAFFHAAIMVVNAADAKIRCRRRRHGIPGAHHNRRVPTRDAGSK
jgi:hypothetical protein